MSTPKTDALFARHIDESCRARTDEARPDLWRIAKRQVEELLEHARQLERDRARLVETMRVIAKPALGGKAQQYAAQAILHDLGEL